jgi:hypothetical protein
MLKKLCLDKYLFDNYSENLPKFITKLTCMMINTRSKKT